MSGFSAGPLTIANGQARLSAAGFVTAAGFEGTVDPAGKLVMRLASTPNTRAAGAMPGIEMIINGRIDATTGTASARQMAYYCRHDLLWQKTSR
jgi:hypothetical protein